MEESLLKIIQKNPIGTALDSFPASFNVACEKERLPRTPDSLDQLGHDSLKNIAFFLILTLQALPASSLLPSHGGGTILVAELSRLGHQIRLSSFDRRRVCPLLEAVLAKRGDVAIWSEVYKAVRPTPQEARVTPSPANASPRTCKAVQPTPLRERHVPLAEPRLTVTTSSGPLMLSSEVSMSRDSFLRSELKSLYVDVPGFHEAFFGGVPDLRQASEAIFRECQLGSDPLYRQGWKGWPRDGNQHSLWTWFTHTISNLADLAATRSRPLARLDESPGGASLNVGFVEDAAATASSGHPWSTVVIAGQLGPHAGDLALDAWIDMARCLGRVLAAQDTRRFALGFTLHGPLMRLWECDRVGGMGSSQLDVNRDGLQFVQTVLAFLWMSGEQLGFDPTIQTSADGQQRFIDIQRRGQPKSERLLIDRVMMRTSRISGRATTCWKARREADGRPLVIKDSWQYADREEEGRLLQLAASRQVVNVARYYHHETVVVGGIDDDVHACVRRGLQASKGTSCEPARPMPRLPSGVDAGTQADVLRNRVHRRVIVADYGKPIYRASSISVLLDALIDCIRGHGSLHAAGLLHRDVSINNLIISSREESRRGYLIDLDLAVSPDRQPEASAAGTKTGTRAFMAVGLLLGEHHTFMHDLESFFWVLFWICVHHSGPGREVDNALFERWTDEGDAQLASAKRGLIGDEQGFLSVAEEHFTQLYRPMARWVNELRKVVFPRGEAWKTEDEGLYADMIGVLRSAREALGPEEC